MGVRWGREREGAQSYDGQNACSSIIQYITYSLEFTVIYFRYRSGSLIIIIIIIIIINNTTGSSTVNCSIPTEPCRTHPNQPPMQKKGNKILPNLLYATKVCYCF
jgi:hypothetical protein